MSFSTCLDQQEEDCFYETPHVASGGRPPWRITYKIQRDKLICIAPHAGRMEVVVVTDDNNSETKPIREVDWDVFLKATYRFSAMGRAREAVDWIIDYLDDLLNAGKFRECNAILRSADPEQLTDPLIVTCLGITLAAKHKLAGRMNFYLRALQTVAKRRGEEGAERLLNKYR